MQSQRGSITGLQGPGRLCRLASGVSSGVLCVASAGNGGMNAGQGLPSRVWCRGVWRHENRGDEQRISDPQELVHGSGVQEQKLHLAFSSGMASGGSGVV